MSDTNQNCDGKSKQPILLCIDDDPLITEAIRLRLKEYDVEVRTAFHGMHGVHEAISCKPDLIISDMRMPQGEGQVVVECIRSNRDTCHIPIIILTGLREQPLKKRLRRFSVQDYFTKPVEFDELRKAIEKYIPLRKRELVKEGAT